MKAVCCLVILFFAQTFGQILSPLDEEWKNYSPEQIVNMMDTAQKARIDQHRIASLQDKSFVAKNVRYFLYTKSAQTPWEIANDDPYFLKKSTFDPSKKTKVLIHGFMNDYQQPSDAELTAAYLKYQDVNILAIDWSKLAATPYNTAVDYTRPVGQEVAKMIDLLVSTGGADVSDIHIIGHSLGAHIAGFTANYVTSGRITRVTGLDPALPFFGNQPATGRLDPLDADIVDCIHTCGGALGFYQPLCTHDFYPNGGVPIQPGCGFDLFGGNSHGRSYELYAASIAGYQFPSKACSDFQQLQTDFCTGGWTGLLGEMAATTPAGIYLLKTSGFFPYTI